LTGCRWHLVSEGDHANWTLGSSWLDFVEVAAL
jgi:hypothetical protein